MYVGTSVTHVHGSAFTVVSTSVVVNRQNHNQGFGVALTAGGKSIRPGMASPCAGDEPGPGAYGPSLTESWLTASQPSLIPVPAFGSSIARQAQELTFLMDLIMDNMPDPLTTLFPLPCLGDPLAPMTLPMPTLSLVKRSDGKLPTFTRATAVGRQTPHLACQNTSRRSQYHSKTVQILQLYSKVCSTTTQTKQVCQQICGCSALLSCVNAQRCLYLVAYESSQHLHMLPKLPKLPTCMKCLSPSCVNYIIYIYLTIIYVICLYINILYIWEPLIRLAVD